MFLSVERRDNFLSLFGVCGVLVPGSEALLGCITAWLSIESKDPQSAKITIARPGPGGAQVAPASAAAASCFLIAVKSLFC